MEGNLPEGWVEKLDPNTNKTYYINRATKQKQWKRPSFENPVASSSSQPPSTETKPSSSTATTKARPSAPNISETSKLPSAPVALKPHLPPPPTAAASKPMPPPPSASMASKPPARQTSPLPANAGKITLNSDIARDLMKKRQENKALNDMMKDKPAPVAPIPIIKPPIPAPPPPSRLAASTSSKSNQSGPRVSFADDELRPSLSTSSKAPPPPPPPPLSSRPSTRSNISSSKIIRYESNMDRIGNESKSGFILKQSSILGRWKKRYFIIADDRLVYQEDEKGSNRKEFIIRPTTNLAYITSGKSYSINIRELYTVAGKVADDVNVMTKDAEELEEWYLAITSHIHVQYKKQYNMMSDFWDDGDVGISFWKVPSSTADFQRQALGIRTLPAVTAPKTGEGIRPGEIFEVIQVVYRAENIFLRLADDKGWIFQAHPTESYPLCQRLKGAYDDSEQIYYYPSSFDKNWVVFLRPSVEATIINTYDIEPGMRIIACASWCAELDHDDDDDHMILPTTFIKLKDDKYWTPTHNYRGEEVLRLS